MENEFIPYDQALALKELGFNELCFGYFHYIYKKDLIVYPIKGCVNSALLEKEVSAPLYQQAFRWLWNKTGKYIIPIQKNDKEWFAIGIVYKTYEEAELECLKKLIKICSKLK